MVAMTNRRFPKGVENICQLSRLFDGNAELLVVKMVLKNEVERPLTDSSCRTFSGLGR